MKYSDSDTKATLLNVLVEINACEERIVELSKHIQLLQNDVMLLTQSLGDFNNDLIRTKENFIKNVSDTSGTVFSEQINRLEATIKPLILHINDQKSKQKQNKNWIKKLFRTK